MGCLKHANLLHHVLHIRPKTQEGKMGKIYVLIFNYGFSKTEKYSKEDLRDCFQGLPNRCRPCDESKIDAFITVLHSVE